jgi:hypothetical protein
VLVRPKEKRSLVWEGRRELHDLGFAIAEVHHGGVDDKFYLVDRVDEVDGRKLPERSAITNACAATPRSLLHGDFATAIQL